MYKIKVTPNYYYGTFNVPRPHFLTEYEISDDGHGTDDTALWNTREDAQLLIDRLESGIYYMQHGEAGRPSYRIIKAAK